MMETTDFSPGLYKSGPETIKTNMLEPIPYEYAGTRDINIVIEQPEYTAVCPRTGLPDFGAVIIEYVPGRFIVELKSLKYYFLQYRTVGIFYENAVNRILDDLIFVLRPKKMLVTGKFTARGGISTTVCAEYTGKGDRK